MQANQPNTSFIPKTPITAQQKKRGNTGLFVFVSFIIFVLSIASSGGVYWYRGFMTGIVEDKNELLERASENFQPAFVDELKRLDTRLVSSQDVLSRHTAFSEFFSVLEENTLKNVQFTSFEYTSSDTDKKTISIMLDGVATSYSSVALQADAFGKNKYIKNPIFSGLNLDEQGYVGFSVSAELDPSLISYKRSLQ